MLRLSEELEVNRSLKERVLCTVGVVSAEELNLPQHCPELDESGPREQLYSITFIQILEFFFYFC